MGSTNAANQGSSEDCATEQREESSAMRLAPSETGIFSAAPEQIADAAPSEEPEEAAASVALAATMATSPAEPQAASTQLPENGPPASLAIGSAEATVSATQPATEAAIAAVSHADGIQSSVDGESGVAMLDAPSTPIHAATGTRTSTDGNAAPDSAEAARRLQRFTDEVQVTRQSPIIKNPPRQRPPVRRQPPQPRSTRAAAQRLAHIPASKAWRGAPYAEAGHPTTAATDHYSTCASGGG